MQNRKIKKFFSLLMIFIIALSFFGFSPNFHKVRAGMWGESMKAAAFQNLWKEMYDAFREALRGMMKRQAANMIVDRVRSLLTGRSSRSLMITNYEDYIFGNARREAMIFSNSFFRSITRNVSSSTNRIQRGVQTAIENEIDIQVDKLGPDIDNYVQGGTANLFDTQKGGGTSAAMATVANPYNNSFGSYIRTSQLVEGKMKVVEESAKARAVAGQGFDSKTDSSTGLIDLPGSITKEIVATAETLSMDMVSTATSMPEIIGNMAAEVISKALESGIAKVTRPVDNKLTEINQKVRGGTRDVQKKIYKGLKFSDH